jgi:hypothetical protein
MSEHDLTTKLCGLVICRYEDYSKSEKESRLEQFFCDRSLQWSYNDKNGQLTTGDDQPQTKDPTNQTSKHTDWVS